MPGPHGGYLANKGMPGSHVNIEFTTSAKENEETTRGVNPNQVQSQRLNKKVADQIYT